MLPLTWVNFSSRFLPVTEGTGERTLPFLWKLERCTQRLCGMTYTVIPQTLGEVRDVLFTKNCQRRVWPLWHGLCRGHSHYEFGALGKKEEWVIYGLGELLSNDLKTASDTDPFRNPGLVIMDLFLSMGRLKCSSTLPLLSWLIPSQPWCHASSRKPSFVLPRWVGCQHSVFLYPSQDHVFINMAIIYFFIFPN